MCFDCIETDLKLLGELGLKLVYTVDTHIHADHITSALQLKREAGSRIVYPAASRVPCADVELHDGQKLQIVQGVPINDFSRQKIDATINELKEERSLVAELLPK